jgi:hypothetical protein
MIYMYEHVSAWYVRLCNQFCEFVSEFLVICVENIVVFNNYTVYA